jgi:hypothetical protein
MENSENFDISENEDMANIDRRHRSLAYFGQMSIFAMSPFFSPTGAGDDHQFPYGNRLRSVPPARSCRRIQWADTT